MKFMNRKKDLPILPVGKEAELIEPKDSVKHLEVVRSLIELKDAELNCIESLNQKTWGIDFSALTRNLNNQKELYKKMEVELIKHG